MEKVLVHLAASQLASGVMANLPDDLKISVDLTDPNVRAENLMAWEIHRAFYHAITRSLSDSSWPDPPVNTTKTGTSLGAGLLAAAAPLLAAGGPLAPFAALIPQVADLVKKSLETQTPPAPKLPTPIPDPGATPAVAQP